MPPLGELRPEWVRNGELGSAGGGPVEVDARGAKGESGAGWAGVDEGAWAGGARGWVREVLMDEIEGAD